MSIKKVAEMAGVSIATVSRYFNNPKLLKKETLLKVENAIGELNYQPNSLAKNFRRGKSGIILVVVHNIGDPVYENFTQTISQIAHSKGYDILIKETNHKSLNIDECREMLNSKRVDGLIVLVDIPELDAHRSLLNNLPIVIIQDGAIPEGISPLHIGLDNIQAAETATNHLIGLGHKSIACITPASDNTAYINRQKGFINAMNKASLSNKPIFFVRSDINNTNDIINQLLKNHSDTTALFCTNDDIAIDALLALKQQQVQVPEELSIVGFNNIRYASKTTPPLTTLEPPFVHISKHAIEMLCAKIDKIDYPQSSSSTYHHKLITRSSTATPCSATAIISI